MMKRKGTYLAALVPAILASCTWDQVNPEFDCTIAPVEIALTSSQDTGCGAADGSFEVSASGGEAPYEFSSEAGSNANGAFADLSAGNYTVVATDINGCSSELAVNIQNQDGVNLDNLTSTDAGCGSTSGSISIQASGGSEPYFYSINGGTAQQTASFTGLASGSYDVKIEDQLGCEVTETVDILSGVSYSSSIKSIIENNCAISGCHNGSVSPNLTTFSSIQNSASRIKARTGNKTMPKGGSLTQEEIDLIACWVDDGALQN